MAFTYKVLQALCSQLSNGELMYTDVVTNVSSFICNIINQVSGIITSHDNINVQATVCDKRRL